SRQGRTSLEGSATRRGCPLVAEWTDIWARDDFNEGARPIVFSADGNGLLTSEDRVDGALQVWNAQTGELLQQTFRLQGGSRDILA
ncbi:MAG: hypothetical protein ACRD3J_24265, partial [Thermoanaerobaculia bacterium]